MPRSRGKADGVQADIVAELRAAGYDVDILSRYAGHPYDLVVTGWHHGLAAVVSARIEVKSPGGTLTSAEQEYHARQRWPLAVAQTAAQVRALFGH